MPDFTSPPLAAAMRELSLNKSLPPSLFVSPPAAGRKITAGFSYAQRIGKSAVTDVWFPDMLKQELDKLVTAGTPLGPEHFPAQWAAVRQFELLQEAGNYKIYDMDATYLTRTLMDLTRNMRGGGYRITVASIGSYSDEAGHDDLEILDKRLQDRIARLIHMLYLEEQSATINKNTDAALAAATWDYQTALPHIGVTLGARNLFRPINSTVKKAVETFIVPAAPYQLGVTQAASWIDDLGVKDAENGQVFAPVKTMPLAGQYSVQKGIYQFSPADIGRAVTLSYRHMAGRDDPAKILASAERKHKMAQHFFDILKLLPQNHIVHDTAVGLQLPELIGENEWIYCAPEDETLQSFNSLLTDLFKPFDGISSSALAERADVKDQVKGTVQHMRSYGDRMTPESDAFYRGLARYALN